MNERTRPLVILVVLALGPVVRSTSGVGPGLAVTPIPESSVDPVHKTYWLIGSNAGSPPYNWNGTGFSPGPLLTASDGDNVTIMLQSKDSVPHNWYLDFNNDLILDPNEVVTKSPDFVSPTIWFNWTFTARLGSVIPHGGAFIYRCQYHPFMYGDFKFNAGPVASFSHSPTTPLVGHQASFDASTSWPSTNANNITSYSWDFGDGNTGTGATATHSYSTSKTYTVSLNVTDNLLQNASTTGNVTVLNPPPVPFDYTLSVTPGNATTVLGQDITATVSLALTFGAPENVTLSSTISPYDASIRVSFNGSASTSGFPSYSASMKITTSPSTPNGTYTVTVIALSSTGVAHNASFALTLSSLPPICACAPFYFGPLIIGTVVFASVITIFVVYRRGRKKMNIHRAEAAIFTKETWREPWGVL